MDKDTLSLQDLTDAGLRRKLFKEMSETLSSKITRGACDDGPGSIAKLMERAFQTGLAMRGIPDLDQSKDDARRPLTEADLPSTLRRQLYKFKLMLGIGLDGSQRREPTVRGMVLIMQPRRPGYSHDSRRDEWLSPLLKKMPFSLNVINQLVALGLYQRPEELNDGWMVTVMSEWGYELLTRGSTCGVKGRVPGSSGTFETFSSLVNDLNPSELLHVAATEMGFVEREEGPPSVPPPGPKH